MLMMFKDPQCYPAYDPPSGLCSTKELMEKTKEEHASLEYILVLEEANRKLRETNSLCKVAIVDCRNFKKLLAAEKVKNVNLEIDKVKLDEDKLKLEKEKEKLEEEKKVL
jgi:hypothetical protein